MDAARSDRKSSGHLTPVARRLPRHGTDGADLICFTTGRGSTYGCKPVPSLKLATKSTLYRHMELDMDYDCGGIVDGRLSIAQAGEALFQLMLAAASGTRTKSELNGLGDNESVPWQLGAVM